MLKRIVATAVAVAFALTLASGLAVATAKPAPAGKVNINTASAEQLTTLPGIGPKLAARIANPSRPCHRPGAARWSLNRDQPW